MVTTVNDAPERFPPEKAESYEVALGRSDEATVPGVSILESSDAEDTVVSSVGILDSLAADRYSKLIAIMIPKRAFGARILSSRLEVEQWAECSVG